MRASLLVITGSQVRPKWSDSGGFYDTEEMYQQAFALDWGRALRAHGLAAYILKHDDGESDDEDENVDVDAVVRWKMQQDLEMRKANAELTAADYARKDGDEEGNGELDEIGHVLWEHHGAIYRTYDAYAAIGAKAIGGGMGFNGFQQFVQDCNLVRKGSKYTSKTHFDQLFIQVNAREQEMAVKKHRDRDDVSQALRRGASSSAQLIVDDDEIAKHGAREQAEDDVRTLSRHEWLQCLVRIAVMRYMLEGQTRIPDASRAVRALLELDILPNLGGAALHDANEFRTKACYTEKTTYVLLQHETSLRVLFAVVANPPGGGGIDVANKLAATLVSFAEWMQLIRALDLIDSEFTIREAALCFSWSRMRVIDDSSKRSKLKMGSLCLEVLRCDASIAHSIMIDEHKNTTRRVRPPPGSQCVMVHY